MLAAVVGILGMPLRAVPSPSGPAPIPPAPSIRQWHGDWGGGADFHTRVIRDSRAWILLWRSMRRSPPCKFDSTSFMAVLIAIGSRPTGGYRVDVVSASAVDRHLVVRYREVRPSRDTYVIEAITHPWVVALLLRSRLPVVFRPIRTSG